MTNPIGKNTRNIGVNLPKDLVEELDRLCSESGITRNKYIRTVLETAAANNWKAAEERLLLRESKETVAPPSQHNPKQIIYRISGKKK